MFIRNYYTVRDNGILSVCQVAFVVFRFEKKFCIPLMVNACESIFFINNNHMSKRTRAFKFFKKLFQFLFHSSLFLFMTFYMRQLNHMLTSKLFLVLIFVTYLKLMKFEIHDSISWPRAVCLLLNN